MKREAVIVSAVRTPVGRCGGALSPLRAHDLGALAVREAVARAKIDAGDIDDVVFGNLFNTEVTNMGRYVALLAGLPEQVPGVTLDRGCASSLQAVAYAAAMIETGAANILVAGGAESDSNRNWILEKPAKAYQAQPPNLLMSGAAAPGRQGVPMGVTGENVGRRYGLSRRECDDFALESHRKAARAWDSGYFDQQIVPVPVQLKKGGGYVQTRDECVRYDASAATLAQLQPAFLPDGIVTAGNSSPMSDGASAMVVMEKEIARSLGAERMYRLAGFAVAGVDPLYMGLGPVAAVRKLFSRIGWDWDDIDLIEINEAFAAQAIACIRELSIPVDRLNVNGGAIALGHPLAATGGVLIAKTIYELERRDGRAGLIAFCIGGGQGAAAIIQRL